MSGSREPQQKARKRVEYCQRVVNERVEVCEFLRVWGYVYTSARKYEFLHVGEGDVRLHYSLFLG